MYRITSFEDILNGVLPPHADDFRERQRLLLFEEHQQWCSETIYGTRHMLWWCPICKCPWWQGDGVLELNLPTARCVQLAHRFNASITRDGRRLFLPRRTCAKCLGAHLMAQTYVNRLGSVLLWQPLSRPPLPLSVADLHKGSTLLALTESTQQDAVEQEAHAMLAWQIDEPCSLDGMPLLLDWFSRHLPPLRQDECQALSAANTALLQRFEHPLPGWKWVGFLWHPPQHHAGRMLSPDPLTLLLAAIQPAHLPASIFPLFTRWQSLFPRVIDATGWDLDLL